MYEEMGRYSAVATPAPTSALFFRPSPVPSSDRPGPTLPPWADVGAVLVPKEGKDAVPGAGLSKDPPGELAAGKARAALLTPGQAARLTAGFRAYPVPEGKGLIPVRAEALTEDGQSFLLFLLREDRQDALRENGLFSLTRRLYSPEDPVRYLVDGSRDFPG